MSIQENSTATNNSISPSGYPPLNRANYDQAEGKAGWYFTELNSLTNNESTLKQLTNDFSHWYQETISANNRLDLEQPIEDWSMLQKLRANRDVSGLMRKTVQYIFLRDLGKDLTDYNTIKQIDEVVVSLQSQLRKQPADETELLESHLHKIASKYGVESSYHWLLLKLSEMRELFHAHDAETEGMRKLVKIIAGVVMHQLVEDPDIDSTTLDQTIRLGYCYGLTYPFIDDLLDSSPDLTDQDKLAFNDALRISLQTGSVPAFPKIAKPSATLKRIYHELKWAFEYIQNNLTVSQAKEFFKKAYIFFEAQAIDRNRRLGAKQEFSMEQLFLPVMLKSAGCRLIARDLVQSEVNEQFEYRTFCFGIYNQFNDDIKDIFDDLADHNLTPYTYFLTQKDRSATSPYQFYWAVVYYLIHEVYQNDTTTKALFLERCINAHRSLKQKVGEQKYQQLRQQLLFTDDQNFDSLIDQLVEQQATGTWLDKLISQEIATNFQNKRETQQQFIKTYEGLVNKIENHLNVTPLTRLPDGKLAQVSNYALLSGGKRLRSVLAYYMGQFSYQFTDEQCQDMASMLEYMHTASLVFDDLPSQDNADRRRGKPTVHVKYQSSATAELSGIYLMMRAVEIQSAISSHPANAVLKSLQYAANTTQLICEGQLRDIKANYQQNNQQQLETTYWLKTGLAIEAALVIPALLAEQDEIHISHLKQLAKHIGMAFQIKDDLLDLSGDHEQLGKPTAQDETKQTLIDFLGEEQATNRMFEHYYQAIKIIEQHFAPLKEFYVPLLNFVIYRHH